MDEDDVNETARLARTSGREKEEQDRGGPCARLESDSTGEGLSRETERTKG